MVHLPCRQAAFLVFALIVSPFATGEERKAPAAPVSESPKGEASKTTKPAVTAAIPKSEATPAARPAMSAAIPKDEAPAVAKSALANAAPKSEATLAPKSAVATAERKQVDDPAPQHSRDSRGSGVAARRVAMASTTGGRAKSAEVTAKSAPETPVAAAADTHTLHWSYEGATGPQAWARLSPEFAKCGNGQRQSPIDIRDGMKVELDPIAFEYKPSSFRVIDNGHAIQANVTGWNSMRVMGRRFRLVQFHFHSPSEELIDGRQFDMVVHLVHQDSEGRLAVVAVLVEGGGTPAGNSDGTEQFASGEESGSRGIVQYRSESDPAGEPPVFYLYVLIDDAALQ